MQSPQLETHYTGTEQTNLTEQKKTHLAVAEIERATLKVFNNYYELIDYPNKTECVSHLHCVIIKESIIIA